MLLLSQSLSLLQTDSETTVLLCLMGVILLAAFLMLSVANRIGKVERQGEAEKKCPYCAELIKKEAIICRFCGRALPVPDSPQQPVVIEKIETEMPQDHPSAMRSPKPQPQKWTIKATRKAIPVGLLIVCLALAVGFMFTRNSESSISSPIAEQPSTYLNNSNNVSNDTGSTYSSPDDTSWFSGGTLHESTMAEWRNASYANRLATAADFIVAWQDVDFGDLNGFKEMATDLETCISTTGEGGAADNERTKFISAMCLVTLYPRD